MTERAVGHDFFVAVDGHGDAKRKTHKQCAKGLQAVEPFRHEGFPESRLAVARLRKMVDLVSRCRGRHERWNGCGWKVLIEKASEALAEEGGVGRGELDGELGIRCAKECLIGRGGSREKKLWSAKSGERLCEGKALMEEKTGGNDRGAGVVFGNRE